MDAKIPVLGMGTYVRVVVGPASGWGWSEGGLG